MRGWGHSCSTQAHTRTGTDTGPPALEALEIQGKKKTQLKVEIQHSIKLKNEAGKKMLSLIFEAK